MNIESQCSLISMVMGHSAGYWLGMINWIGLLLFGLGTIIFAVYTLPYGLRDDGGIGLVP